MVNPVDPILNVVYPLAKFLQMQKLHIAVAESCTGGFIAQSLTAIAGSSSWFDRGFVTYSNAAKMQMLGVQAATLAQFGAVSAETALEMVVGALRHSESEMAIAVTGIAGPDGGSATKPVGTVFIAWGIKEQGNYCEQAHFAGDRLAVRTQTVIRSLEYGLKFFSGSVSV